MVLIELSRSQEEITARVRDLARLNFAPRALEYDRTAAFPAEDFNDLFRAGLLNAVVPSAYGGLGLGPFAKRPIPAARDQWPAGARVRPLACRQGRAQGTRR